MSNVAVVIPTVTGREEYLERAVDGYEDRHQSDHSVVPFVVQGQPSGGLAWQDGAEWAVEDGAFDYLHLTNDDIVPGFGYLEPMIEAADAGKTPVVCVVNGTPEVFGEDMMPLPGNPTNEVTAYYEGPMPQVIEDWTPADPQNDSQYPSLPFCSMQQWESIGPMIPTQYGTDKWFGHRARKAGFENVVRSGAIFYHYAALAKRDNGIEGWLGFDRLTFDQNIAFPMYETGALPLDCLHPEWNTLAGRKMARDWYREHVPRPEEGFPWEQDWIPDNCKEG